VVGAGLPGHSCSRGAAGGGGGLGGTLRHLALYLLRLQVTPGSEQKYVLLGSAQEPGWISLRRQEKKRSSVYTVITQKQFLRHCYERLINGI